MYKSMAYSKGIVFKETPVFSRQIVSLLADDEYRGLQQALIINPGAGAVIRHSGGLRKIRWRASRGGKRGGIRIIYFWFVREDEIFMLLAYDKTKKADLSARELSLLRRLVDEVCG